MTKALTLGSLHDVAKFTIEPDSDEGSTYDHRMMRLFFDGMQMIVFLEPVAPGYVQALAKAVAQVNEEFNGPKPEINDEIPF